jgi:GT2 family glycosyltransferase
VICSYSLERWDRLAGAVRSAQAQTEPPLEVIVAVDHNDALLDRVRTDLPGVRTVRNTGPRGLSGARNAGLTAARGDVIAFLDDDARAAPDWLEQLVTPYSDPQVLGVGGTIEPSWDGGRPAGFPAEFQWVVGCSYEGLPTSTEPVRNVIGANMSIRRSVTDSVGGFSSDMGRVGKLPLGCEETELCIRARQRLPGGRFVYEPRARVEHSVPASRATWSYFRARCFAEGVSKAQVAATAGARDGLSSERTYTMQTLPRGVARAFRDVLRGDSTGLGRAARIITGLALTAAGYATASARLRWR